MVYVATQNDSVYAFDADGLSGIPLWQVSFINPVQGITPVSCMKDGQEETACSVYPIFGITSTPVIDPTTNTLYLVTRTDNNGVFFQTLHALDITTGIEKFGGPVNITGSVPGTGAQSKNGVVPFDALHDIQRAGLLLLNGTLYIGWAGAWHGWIMAYNAQTLQQTAIFNTAPNSKLGGIWASGNGIAADESGNIYAAVGNSLFDANLGGVDYGDSLLKLSPDLNVLDYFAPSEQSCRQLNDLDLGSAGPMILPAQPATTPNELIIAGKGGTPCDTNPVASRIYLLNQDDLGAFNAAQDQVIEEIIGAPAGYWSSPAYWQNEAGTYIYSAGASSGSGSGGDYLKMFTVTNGLLSTAPFAQSTNTYPTGATPSVSSNGTADGIIWAVKRPNSLGIQPGIGVAVLYAYDATNVSNMFYNSAAALSQGVARDRGGCANKFAVPTIANGKVYVGTQNELDIFGLLSPTNSPAVYLANPCWAFSASNLGTPVTQALKLTNSGSATLAITNVAITGSNAPDFTQTNNCTSVRPGAQCTINVTFTASLEGPETGYVMITDNAVGSPHNMYLTAVGQYATTVTWPTPAPITYGTALSGTQLNATANVPGTFAYSPASGAILTAGNQALSVTFTPTNTTLYKTVMSTVQIQVNQAGSSVTWASPAAIGYGTALSAGQLNATANVPGTFLYSPTLGSVLGAGTQLLTVVFTPTDSTDYSPSSGNVSLQVNPGSLIVTASNSSGVYGQPLPALTYNVTGFVNGDTITSATSGAPMETTTGSPTSSPGLYPIGISQGSLIAANYTFGSFVNGVLNIQQALSTVVLVTQSSTLSASQNTTLTATLTVTGAGLTPTGTINFMTGATLLGSATLSVLDATDSTATLILNGAQLTGGANNISAVYAGDVNYIGATSSPITVSLVASQYGFGSINVGIKAPALTLIYQFTQATTLSAVEILTAGATGLDYADAGNSTCVSGTQYNSGQACAINVSFTPSLPGPRAGAVSLFAQGSTVPLMTWYLNGSGKAAAVVIDPGTQSTVAQLSNSGQAFGPVVDGNGNIYVVDKANSKLLKFSASTFSQTTIISAGLLNPTSVAIDGAGNLYVSDTGNSRVVSVPNEQGGLNSADMSTVNIPGLISPGGLAADSGGNLFVVDSIAGTLNEIVLATGSASVVISGLIDPQGLALDGLDDFYISSNNQVSEYPAGGGTPAQVGSGYNNPQSIAIDTAGAVYVADSNNARIVRVDPGGSQSVLSSAGLIAPQGIALDGSDNLYISDGGSVYQLNRTQPAPLAFPNTAVGNVSSAQVASITNGGSTLLNISSIVSSGNFSQTPSGGTDCSSSEQLSPGASCLLAVEFVPLASGALNGTFEIADDAANAMSTQTLPLSGLGLQGTEVITFPPIPTQTYGAGPVTLNATASSGLPISYTLISGPAIVSGTLLTVTGTGSITVQASQPGNNNYSAASPVSQTFSVNQAAQAISFTENAPSSAGYGHSFTVSATATSGLAVSFSASGVCTQAGNTITMTSSTGTCTITASQSGSSNYLAAQSVTESTTAQKAAPTVSLTGVPATASYESSFSVTASSNSGAVATITVTGVCSINGTSITMTSGIGKCAVTAKWPVTKNYSAATTSQNTIAQRLHSVITWPTPAPIVYGTALSGTQLDATANVGGTFSYTPAAGTVLSAGNHTITANFTPTLNQYYYASQAKVTLVVTKTATAGVLSDRKEGGKRLPDGDAPGIAVKGSIGDVTTDGGTSAVLTGATGAKKERAAMLVAF